MKLLTTILIYLLLRLNGWKACRLHDGRAGWCKQFKHITLIGDWRYALQHL